LAKLNLKGKNVLITGASSGIGKELSECFAREGSNLFLGCHPLEGEALVNWAASLHDEYGVRTEAFPIDLSEEDGPDNLRAMVLESVDRIDVLVNNAGILAYGSFHEIPLERQELLIKVNLIAYFKLMRLFLPEMVEAGEGRILNVVSAAAFQPTVFHATYGAAKAFVQSLSEAVNQEIKGTGVRIQTLNPSYTDTPILKGAGFPERVWWYKISGLSDPAVIARKAMKAFKADRAVHIPGTLNWFAHSVLIRVVPRRLTNFISYWGLKARS
jgi:short-subunit dehydrogenase